jgi:hypothetical protein
MKLDQLFKIKLSRTFSTSAWTVHLSAPESPGAGGFHARAWSTAFFGFLGSHNKITIALISWGTCCSQRWCLVSQQGPCSQGAVTSILKQLALCSVIYEPFVKGWGWALAWLGLATQGLRGGCSGYPLFFSAFSTLSVFLVLSLAVSVPVPSGEPQHHVLSVRRRTLRAPLPPELVDSCSFVRGVTQVPNFL